MSTTHRQYGDPSTRRQILATTWSLIEEGDEEVRLSDVAARAGVSRRAVYLHFSDRAGLLTALVAFMDEAIGVRELAAPVRTAGSPEERLAAVVAFYAQLNPRVEPVARLLEARAQDVAARAAWRSRMDLRRQIHRGVFARIAEADALAPPWTVDAAADVLHAMMLPGAWRELTTHAGWTATECQAHLTVMVCRTFLPPPTADS